MKNNQRGVGAVIVIVIIAVLAILGVASYIVFSINKQEVTNSTLNTTKSTSSQNNNDDCIEAYADEDLCRALKNFTVIQQYQVLLTITDDGKISTTRAEFDGDKAYIKDVYDIEKIHQGNTTYTKDPTDGKWWKQVFDSTYNTFNSIDELKPNWLDKDSVERTVFSRIGEEPCDKSNCIKYKLIENNTLVGLGESYAWIDTDDFLLRKLGGDNIENTYTYYKKSVNIPTDTKDATQTQKIIPDEYYSKFIE